MVRTQRFGLASRSGAPSMKAHPTVLPRERASRSASTLGLGSVQGRHGPYRRTTGQVRVRVTPSTSWIFPTTSLPSASRLEASARAITS